ncbi:unnamed protein product [Thelazia callipaeda]|uniref:Morc6_S5 domain-containing protein n=1 Tax=Thelazia callipaeda TaxID=103827 RepID=A0A0N5D1R2_THECL|nr:unnamed protein product [Thelazia callipaeda]
MSVDLSSLNRASITAEHLQISGSLHDFLFGAVAEFVDNARDAKAVTLHIDYNNGQLSFLDDGCGMKREEVLSIISFGSSSKSVDPDMIGRYGNGLKSGAMRLGKDFILFTKKEGLMTCMLLSATFIEEHNFKEVIVPIPSFLENRHPYYESMHQVQKHELEMQIICHYSPFHNECELLSQFSRIATDTGTLVVCYNLRCTENGVYEMDFATDTSDIRLTNCFPQREEEKNSLRAYLSVLYINPRMRIFLRGDKVETKRIISTLYMPLMYRHQVKNPKICTQREFEKYEQKKVEFFSSLVVNHVAQCKSQIENFELTYPDYITNSRLHVHHQKLLKEMEDAEKVLAKTETGAKELQKLKSDPIPLIFYFGFNIHCRDCYGCMLYSNGRLVRMYEKLAVHKEKKNNSKRCLGVVGIADIPYSFLEPTHNKQSFVNKREYTNILKALNDYLVQYWTDVAIETVDGGIECFWYDLFGKIVL